MYFPYLRGRQFELIGLRELVEKNKMSEKVIPIIEPVKLSSTLFKTLECFVNNKHEIGVIINQEVGDFKSLLEENKELSDKFNSYLSNKYVIVTVINNGELNLLIDKVVKPLKISIEEIAVITKESEYINDYLDVFNNEIFPKYDLIADSRELRRNIGKNKIILADKFSKQARNSDYCDKTSEFFSEEHLYYAKEGCVGFADYSIVGDVYKESGFAPLAVAIHIVYFDQADKLWINHFVSDSNSDISNPAKKFYEALSKLEEWANDQKNINTENTKTYAIEIFKDYFEKEAFPGLGTVKKLSIMHHLELISNYLEVNS